MNKLVFFVFSTVVYCFKLCSAQVLQFGNCVHVEPMKLFNIEKFLGKWYEIERFPIWYEDYGVCAYKHFERCGRNLEIQHAYIKNGVQYILHMDSSYTPGHEAVFPVNKSNIDPVGIPLTVINTDYKNYAVVYGCKTNPKLTIKYMAAWILARDTVLDPETLENARHELNSVPYGNIAYLEPVKHTVDQCVFYWTAHINAEANSEEDYDSLR